MQRRTPALDRRGQRRALAQPFVLASAAARHDVTVARLDRGHKARARLQGNAWQRINRTPTAYHAQMFEALESGTMADYYGAQVVSDEEVERGVAEGRLVVDTRLRDALGQIRAGSTPLAFLTPSLVDEATYAVEAAVLGEADVVRLQRRLDALEHRLATVEGGLPNRIYRKLAGPAKRVLRRD